MAPKLYTTDMSPPCRAVYLTAAHLKISLDHVEINLMNDDILKPEFVKKNPQHLIPTLEDDGKVIWDSHAINAYLVTKYGQNDSLYPVDPYKRAIIDQRLHFDSGVLFALVRRMVRPMMTKGVKEIFEKEIEEINQGYAFLNAFLEGQEWLAGNNVTLADFSVLCTVTSLNVLVPIDANKYPNVIAWIKTAEQLPYYNVNQKGLDEFRAFIGTLLG